MCATSGSHFIGFLISSPSSLEAQKGVGLLGFPWWSGGWDSALSLLRAWVRSLVGDLRSHKSPDAAKKQQQKTNKQTKRNRKKGSGAMKASKNDSVLCRYEGPWLPTFMAQTLSLQSCHFFSLPSCHSLYFPSLDSGLYF